MDITQVANPYDFANPVSRAELFFGRTSEMAEIKYYLEHAKTAARPINIALLGDRAAGKTSILNITEIEANSRGFGAVRIDLDEDDGRSQLVFFHKMLDGILTAACSAGAFGGYTGKTYSTYTEMVNSYSVPEDKLFCPFLFPVQYAHAMRGGNYSAPVSDHAIKHDLALISAEMKKPIVILFDEGNVLAQSRVILEKLRNIFMNISGYMLVLTGTADLFPVMDDVFSPIVRQFKKITVKEFKEKSDTAACVRQPLQRAGIAIDVSDGNVDEIHELSNGRPYEIQLICHLLFRRIQTRRSRRMTLDLGVLEELRLEIERSQDISGRPLLSAINGLNKRQLQALRVLTACDSRGTLEQAWQLNYIFEGKQNWGSQEELRREYERLASRSILEEQNGKVCFRGDYFDRLYTKYFAAEQQVRLQIQKVSPEVALLFGMYYELRHQGDLRFTVGGDEWGGIEATAKELRSSADPFKDGKSLSQMLYFLMFKFRKRAEIPALTVSFRLPWGSSSGCLFPSSPTTEGELERARQNLSTMKTRVENLGGTLDLERRDLPIIPISHLETLVKQTPNEEIRQSIAAQHVRVMSEQYLVGREEEALEHARYASTYNARPGGKQSNNLGYILMTTGDLQNARELFLDAKQTALDVGIKILSRYNLGVIEMKEKHWAEAKKYFEEAKALTPTLPAEDREAACLLVPRWTDAGVSFTEVQGPRVREAIDASFELASRLAADSATAGS